MLHESLLLDCFISNLLMFIVNYENTHPESSHVIFTHSTDIYLVIICCLPDTVPSISDKTAKAQREKRCASKSTWISGRTGPMIASPLSSVLSTILLLCIS